MIFKWTKIAVGQLICSLSSEFREKIRCTSAPMVIAAGRTHLADEFVTCSNDPLEISGSGDGKS
jgi:hypothetical protein